MDEGNWRVRVHEPWSLPRCTLARKIKTRSSTLSSVQVWSVADLTKRRRALALPSPAPESLTRTTHSSREEQQSARSIWSEERWR